MDRHLLNYLPPVLREVLEFQIINGANEPEISLAWDAITRVLANQFLEDADEDGVAVWEQELRLFPKDTDTLEARKARIKAKWNLELPYTLRWLKTGWRACAARTVTLFLSRTTPWTSSLTTRSCRSRTGWRGKSLTCC